MDTERGVPRRQFMRQVAATTALGTVTSATGAAAENHPARPHTHPTWIASLTLADLKAATVDELLDVVVSRMDETLPCRPELICLPETFVIAGAESKQQLSELIDRHNDHIFETMRSYAKANDLYLLCPLYTRSDDRIFNSATLIGRKGEIVGEYRKIRPTVEEIDLGVVPGPEEPPVFQTDFGTVGIQICFDVNWPDGWRALNRAGANIILWPSAFPGGRMLNALAWMTKAHIVASTRPDPARIIDITGDDLAVSGRWEHWVCAAVNLDKALIHTWPYVKRINALRSKYGRRVRVTTMHMEDWTVIENLSLDMPLAEALREFDIPLHGEHIAAATAAQESARAHRT